MRVFGYETRWLAPVLIYLSMNIHNPDETISEGRTPL
jgi:hypothetical protein